MSLIEELKRRKVLKVGATYLVVAWLAVQAVSIAFPAFDAPAWALRVFILLTMLGFPVVMLLTWMIDLTPGGVKFDPDVSSNKGVYVGGALLIALALGWYYYGQPSFRKGDAATPVAADQNSIAVLPFANMSGKPDEDYFSDGMTEELLNVLAKVPQLQVVARTSVFQFKDKGGDVRDIGRKLGVSHIVEGSVRRDGQEVRITAQLVRVSDGFHVWSETYDRKLDSVFALQDEIAARIGDALKLSLGVDKPVAARAAIDPAAYDEYLKGRALLRSRRDIDIAIGHFKAAVAKAPSFAAGWSSLSLACEVIFWGRPMPATEQADMLACQADAADHAAALAPDAATTEHALANVGRARFQYAKAERHYLRAMQLDPSYPDVREDYSELLFEVGRIDDSMQAARQLVNLDPYFVVGWIRIIHDAISLDQRNQVEDARRQLFAIAPTNRYGRVLAIEYALAYSRIDEARAATAEARKRWPDDDFAQTVLPWALGDPGVDGAKAAAVIATTPSGMASPYFVAKKDVAGYDDYIERLGAILQAYYFAYLNQSKVDGPGMLRDPRVKAKLIEYGFPAYWREKGWPATCRPLGDSDFECGIDSPGAAKP